MLKSCDYNDAYKVVTGTITITGGPADTTDSNKRTEERDEGVKFKTSASFINA